MANPYKVVVLDPINLRSRRTFCFLGDVPKAITSAVEGNSKNAKLHLTEYYGNDYKRKLGMAGDFVDALIDSEKKGASEQQIDPKVLAWMKIAKDLPLQFVEVIGYKGKNVCFVDEYYNVFHVTDEESGAPKGKVGCKVFTSGIVVGGALHNSDAAEWSDIEQMLEDGPAQSAHSEKAATAIARPVGRTKPVLMFRPGIEYVTNIHIYPEDRLLEVKDKIFLATDIPVYRQYLFYISEGRIINVYRLSLDGAFTVDIRDQSTKTVLGVGVDKYLYDMRHSYKVESYESFRIIGEQNILDNVLYVVDLAQFTAPIIGQMKELLRDSYQFELFYYGFILKFWPQLTPECFRDYIIDENELEHKYPDLAKSYSTLAAVYKAERDIIDTKNKQAARVASFANGNISIAITQMTAVVSAPRVMLNIRNLFDKLRVTRCIPEIHAYIDVNGKKYLLRKRHLRSTSDIPFPSVAIMKSGLTLAISLRRSDQEVFHVKETHSTVDNEQSRYMFLNIQPNGKYYIRTLWNEEDEYKFDDILKIMKKMSDPIIQGINQLGHYAFIAGNSLPQMTKSNTNYAGMNICVFWKKVMLETTFKLVKAQLEPYMRSRIIASRNVQQFDKYEFLFRKGMHEFDMTAVERIITASNAIQLSNYYSYLSNNTIKQKWDQNYDGRVVKMSHRTTDVRFEVADIRESEFAIFFAYICDFIYRAASDVKVKDSFGVVRDYVDVKKLRKLREQDPELYNLKKYGSKKVYSIICQNQRQPLIYTADEIKAMSAAEVKKLTQYWNFTLNKPAFYGCPNKEYPHLSFMVGVHPKNYCLPCCNKKSQDEDDETRKQVIHAICKRDHVYVEGTGGEVSRHVMAYGKDIDKGRLSKIPTQLRGLVFGTISGNSSYYLVGVEQHLPGAENIGILFSIAEALDVSLPDLIKKCVTELKKAGNISLYNTLLGGTLGEYWKNMQDLIDTMIDIFVGNKIFSKQLDKFTQWPELITEILHILFHVCCFTFIDESAESSEIKGTTMSLFVPMTLHNEVAYILRVRANDGVIDANPIYIILCKRSNRVYPMFAMAADEYFRAGMAQNRTYEMEHPLTQLMFSMVQYDVRGWENAVEKPLDLGFMKEIPGMEITLKFINRQNLCYGVIGKVGDVSGYIPIDYSSHIADKIPITFKALEPGQKTSLSNTRTLIAHINKYIEDKYKLAGADVYLYRKLVEKEFVTVKGKAVGLICNDMCFYFEGGEADGLPSREIYYDYNEVNSLILARAEPKLDNRTRLIGEALYSNYIYQLFLIEFVNFMESERNLEVRGKIKDLIIATNFKKDLRGFRTALKALVGQSDYNLIQSQVQLFYFGGSRAELLAAIDLCVYDFDHLTADALRKMNNKALIVERLHSIAQSFCVVKDIDTTAIEFPNIYMPCEVMTEDKVGYCDGKKLIVKDLNSMCDLLAVDLMDPLKSKYVLNNIWMDTVISQFKFNSYPTEAITIYRLD